MRSRLSRTPPGSSYLAGYDRGWWAGLGAGLWTGAGITTAGALLTGWLSR